MWAGFFCRQDISITFFGRTKEFSEVRGTSLMCNLGVRSRFLDVIYGVRPPNGSPELELEDLNLILRERRLHWFVMWSVLVVQSEQHVIYRLMAGGGQGGPS